MKTRIDTISTGGKDYQFKFGDNVFFGAEDFIMNTDPSKYELQDIKTGEKMDGYKFMWLFMQKILKDVYSEKDEQLDPDEWESLEKHICRQISNMQDQETDDED